MIWMNRMGPQEKISYMQSQPTTIICRKVSPTPLKRAGNNPDTARKVQTAEKLNDRLRYKPMTITNIHRSVISLLFPEVKRHTGTGHQNRSYKHYGRTDRKYHMPKLWSKRRKPYNYKHQEPTLNVIKEHVLHRKQYYTYLPDVVYEDDKI